MTKENDVELKKAALFIAKLLLRTREGRIQWRATEPSLQMNMESFTARIEGDIIATLTKGFDQLSFRLSGLESVERVEGGLQSFKRGNEILNIAIRHSKGKENQFTPESIVYRDLEELIQLAAKPEDSAGDPRFKQAMSYLDKLAV